ncbi:MAG: FUSC family protein [Rhodobacter sp.]|nr:FUSC family protein [Rhodobacter sp.]MCA3457701.1 FUSC family protein [Rhodobacter sp.]MCA3459689.1 FUSC family protein [Rhodobacter sp.]MCA3464345.1 FUSC family protein [Rhodobacter sp.]MCA3467657.1 FUSC family protein [Rhodobacter sp.]
MRWPVPLTAVILAFRAGVAGTLATWIAMVLSLQYPIYAFIAAVIVTDLSPAQSRRLGLRRILATVIGAVCGAALSQLLGPGPVAVGIAVVSAMLLGTLLGAGDGARVAGYICGIVVLDHTAEPWLYATQRFVETALGVIVAWGISYVPKLIGPDST